MIIRNISLATVGNFEMIIKKYLVVKQSEIS